MKRPSSAKQQIKTKDNFLVHTKILAFLDGAYIHLSRRKKIRLFKQNIRCLQRSCEQCLKAAKILHEGGVGQIAQVKLGGFTGIVISFL